MSWRLWNTTPLSLWFCRIDSKQKLLLKSNFFFFVVGVVEWTKLITSFQLWLAFSVCLWDSFWRKGIHIKKLWKKHRIFLFRLYANIVQFYLVLKRLIKVCNIFFFCCCLVGFLFHFCLPSFTFLHLLLFKKYTDVSSWRDKTQIATLSPPVSPISRAVAQWRVDNPAHPPVVQLSCAGQVAKTHSPVKTHLNPRSQGTWQPAARRQGNLKISENSAMSCINSIETKLSVCRHERLRWLSVGVEVL